MIIQEFPDHPIWSGNLSYGPLALSADFQHGEIKTISSSVVFWTGTTPKINDYDRVCFEKDAPIETRKGIKNIQDILVNDIVKTWNESTKKFEFKKVVKTFERIADKTLHIKLSNNQTMKITPEHLIYANGVWIKAGEIKQGDKLLGSINEEIFVESIELINKETRVYNFETEDNHTYIAYGVVVHNDCRVRMKDGSIRVLPFDETNRRIGTGEVVEILDANVGNGGSYQQSIGDAWQEYKASGGDALSFTYNGNLTDGEFMDFLRSPAGQQYASEYGYTAQQVNLFIAGEVGGIAVGALAGRLVGRVGGSIFAAGERNIIRQSFENLGNLEGQGILNADKQLRSNGFTYIGRTPGGYYKYYNSNGAKVQIRPNGQVYRYSGKGNNIIRYDSSGIPTRSHGQEFLF